MSDWSRLTRGYYTRHHWWRWGEGKSEKKAQGPGSGEGSSRFRVKNRSRVRVSTATNIYITTTYICICMHIDVYRLTFDKHGRVIAERVPIRGQQALGSEAVREGSFVETAEIGSGSGIRVGVRSRVEIRLGRRARVGINVRVRIQGQSRGQNDGLGWFRVRFGFSQNEGQVTWEGGCVSIPHPPTHSHGAVVAQQFTRQPQEPRVTFVVAESSKPTG